MTLINSDGVAGVAVNTQVAKTAELQQRQNRKEQATLWNGLGDSVEISEEGRALLQSKIEELDNKLLQDLTEEERRELRTVLSEVTGLSEGEIAALEEEMVRSGGAADEAASEDIQSGGVSEQSRGMEAAAGGGAAASSGASDESESDMEDLEEEIAKLEDEIDELRQKAKSGEGSVSELKTKQMELMSKEAELAQLQSDESS